MATPAYDPEFDGEPLPPELVIEHEPITEAELDRFMAQALELADELHIDLQAAIDELTRPAEDGEGHAVETGGYGIPESVRAFMTGAFDIERADWAMAKMAKAQGQLAEATARRDVLRARVESWFDRAERAASAEMAFFEPMLVAYLRTANEADPKVKSMTLTCGKVTSSGPAVGNELAVVVPDTEMAEAEVIAWAESRLEGDELASVVKVKKTVLISGLRQLVRITTDDVGAHTVRLIEDGTEVPMLAIERKVRTFKVQPG